MSVSETRLASRYHSFTLGVFRHGSHTNTKGRIVMTHFLNIFFVVLALQAVPGTYITVPAGERLEINMNLASVQIEAWEENKVEISAAHSDHIRIEVKAGSTVEIQEFRSPRAALEQNNYLIRLPASMAVQVKSNDGNVTIQGMRANVSVDVNHGAVEVRDVQGTIVLDSDTGDLTIERSVGDVILDANRGSISIRGLKGAIVAETEHGRVTMEDIQSPKVRVTTNNGDIFYDGVIEPGGFYDLASQRGALMVHLPESVSARVSVGTVRGKFESDFDLGGTKPLTGEVFSFTIGKGEAQIELVTYSGDIRLKARKR